MGFFYAAVQSVDSTKANYVTSIANYPGRTAPTCLDALCQNWLDCNSLDYNQSLDQIVVNSRQGELMSSITGNIPGRQSNREHSPGGHEHGRFPLSLR